MLKTKMMYKEFNTLIFCIDNNKFELFKETFDEYDISFRLKECDNYWDPVYRFLAKSISNEFFEVSNYLLNRGLDINKRNKFNKDSILEIDDRVTNLITISCLKYVYDKGFNFFKENLFGFHTTVIERLLERKPSKEVVEYLEMLKYLKI